MATMVDEENTLLEPPRGRDSSSRETLIRSLRSTLGSTLGRRQLMHRGVDHSQSIWRWLGIPTILLIPNDIIKWGCGRIRVEMQKLQDVRAILFDLLLLFSNWSHKLNWIYNWAQDQRNHEIEHSYWLNTKFWAHKVYTRAWVQSMDKN